MSLFWPGIFYLIMLSVVEALGASIYSFILLKGKRLRIIESLYGFIIVISFLLATWMSQSFTYTAVDSLHWTFQKIFLAIYGLGIGLTILSIAQNVRNKRNWIISVVTIIFSLPQLFAGILVLSHDL